MKSMTLLVAMALVSPALVSHASGADLKPPRDGWAGWEVPAVEGAPFYCCWNNWDDRKDARTPCKLDAHRSYGTRDDDGTTDAVTVYARFKDGKVEKLKAVASACPVETSTPVQKLGNVAADDSVRWLMAQARQAGAKSFAHDSVLEHSLAAIGLHRGDVAGKELASLARDNANVEIRKKALFWMAMLRGTSGAQVTSSLMFSDPDPEFRQHAAFALSQSKSPRIATDLIRLGDTDRSGEVRAQAWFWLAQTGAVEAETAISSALRKDADSGVREQAIFALSQLPGERATTALIAVAEDQKLTREQRKRAVFWLSQSESDAAQKYLEKVLARAASR